MQGRIESRTFGLRGMSPHTACVNKESKHNIGKRERQDIKEVIIGRYLFSIISLSVLSNMCSFEIVKLLQHCGD